MFHTISNSSLAILKDLLILDRYRRSSDRSEGDEFLTENGNICLFELFLSKYLENFLDMNQVMARNGQTPFSLHLESGDGASRLIPSRLMNAFSNSSDVINVPETVENFALPRWSHLLFLPLTIVVGGGTVDLLDVNLNPSLNQGGIDLQWDCASEALRIRLRFETSGTELYAMTDFGDITIDITKLEATILLKPEIKARRLLWTLETNAEVGMGKVKPPLPINKKDIAKQIESHFSETFKNILKDHVPVIAGAVGAIPLRPVSDIPEVLMSEIEDIRLMCSLLNLGEPPTRLSESTQEQLSLLLIYNYLNQSIYGTDNDIPGATLLPCNPRHVLPPIAAIPQTAEYEQFVLKHIELAHLANRTDSYIYAEHLIVEEDNNIDCKLVVEHEPLPDVPEESGIECMRYLVAIDAITFQSPNASGMVRLTCSIGVWHRSLATNPNNVISNDVAVLVSEMKGAAPIVLGSAGVNAQAQCFLEWDGKLRLNGDIKILNSSVPFVHDIDIHKNRMSDLGSFSLQSGYLTVHYRLQQVPYAQAYNWVSVNFNKVNLITPSSLLLPPNTRLLLEGYINSDPEEGGIPFRRQHLDQVSNEILLKGWNYDVIHREDSIGNQLSVELRAFFINPDTGNVINQLSASHIINRFSNAGGDEIQDNDLNNAVNSGAVAEWGIPIGQPGIPFVMEDPSHRLKATMTLRNKRFNPTEVPENFLGKTFDIELPSVHVNHDTDPAGSGELKFTFYFGQRYAGQPNNIPLDSREPQNTRTRKAKDSSDLNFTDPPAFRGVLAHPGDTLILEVTGRDSDWNQFGIDKDDRMGTARFEIVVPEGDDIDYRIAGLLTNQSDHNHDFEARVRIITKDPPRSPTFWINEDIDHDLSTFLCSAGTQVTLAYDGLLRWVTSGVLQYSTEINVWTDEPSININTDEPAGTFIISPNITTRYRLAVSNVAGTNFSRELTIQIV